MNIKVGDRFTRLTVMEPAGANRDRHRMWQCLCDCGNVTIVIGSNLRKGFSRSCGCLRVEITRQRSTTHGMTHTPEHQAWQRAKQRCGNPHHPRYGDYGGRGISLTEEWLNDFPSFYAYIGPRPSPQHSIDRYPDNDGNYKPGNVRWATRIQQARNKRPAIQGSRT